jgi:hypothetical protein
VTLNFGYWGQDQRMDFNGGHYGGCDHHGGNMNPDMAGQQNNKAMRMAQIQVQREVQARSQQIAEATLERFKKIATFMDGTGRPWTDECTAMWCAHYHDNFIIISQSGRTMNRDQWMLSVKSFGARRGRCTIRSIWVESPPPNGYSKMPCIDVEFLIRMPDAITGDKELQRSRMFLDEDDGRVLRIESASTPGLGALIDLQAAVMQNLSLDGVDASSVANNAKPMEQPSNKRQQKGYVGQYRA